MLYVCVRWFAINRYYYTVEQGPSNFQISARIMWKYPCPQRWGTWFHFSVSPPSVQGFYWSFCPIVPVWTNWTRKSSTNTRLAKDAFLLKFPHPVEIVLILFLERSFTYGAPYELNKLAERVRRLTNFNMFKSEIKTMLFIRYFQLLAVIMTMTKFILKIKTSFKVYKRYIYVQHK